MSQQCMSERRGIGIGDVVGGEKKIEVMMKRNEVKVEKLRWRRHTEVCLNKTKGNVSCESMFLPQ